MVRALVLDQHGPLASRPSVLPHPLMVSPVTASSKSPKFSSHSNFITPELSKLNIAHSSVSISSTCSATTKSNCSSSSASAPRLSRTPTDNRLQVLPRHCSVSTHAMTRANHVSTTNNTSASLQVPVAPSKLIWDSFSSKTLFTHCALRTTFQPIPTASILDIIWEGYFSHLWCTRSLARF